VKRNQNKTGAPSGRNILAERGCCSSRQVFLSGALTVLRSVKPSKKLAERGEFFRPCGRKRKILRLPLSHGGFLLVQFPPYEWVFAKQEGHDMATTRLHLEWKALDKEHYALIFNTPAWKLLQEKADALGVDTCDMVAEAIANLLGKITSKKVTEKE
jgi:hypothetical protein